MNSTCFLTFSQYMFLLFYFHFYFLDVWKTEKRITSTIVFHFSHLITGRSWADHGATMGDHARHARFQKSWLLRGSRKYKVFSVFRNEQHVFQNIECFVQVIVKKKRFSILKSSYLTLNFTIPYDRRTVSKKICRWSFRPTQISAKNYNLFLATAATHTQIGTYAFW